MPGNWKLQPGVAMDDGLADEVAKIACALQSLSAYAGLACDSGDVPEELQPLVDEGLEAMKRVFVW